MMHAPQPYSRNKSGPSWRATSGAAATADLLVRGEGVAGLARSAASGARALKAKYCSPPVERRLARLVALGAIVS